VKWGLLFCWAKTGELLARLLSQLLQRRAGLVAYPHACVEYLNAIIRSNSIWRHAAFCHRLDNRPERRQLCAQAIYLGEKVMNGNDGFANVPVN
jgi:hypothetical protein